MFYFRANQVKLTSNGATRSLFNWRKDLSNVKLVSFVTTSQSTLPDIDTWLDSNDPAQKTALLARAVQSVSSSQILTTVENVKDNARLTFGSTGYTLFQCDKMPEDINWCLMAVKSNKDTRELGSVFSSIADHSEFNNFAGSLGSLVLNVANPGFRAGVEIVKFVTEVMSQRLQDEDDEQLGLLYLSLNRLQHYKYGERKENGVTDLTGNMQVDYSIFGVEDANYQPSTVSADETDMSTGLTVPKEVAQVAKQTVEAGLAAATAIAHKAVSDGAEAVSEVPLQPADILMKKAKAILQAKEDELLSKAKEAVAGAASGAVSAATGALADVVTGVVAQVAQAAGVKLPAPEEGTTPQADHDAGRLSESTVPAKGEPKEIVTEEAPDEQQSKEIATPPGLAVGETPKPQSDVEQIGDTTDQADHDAGRVRDSSAPAKGEPKEIVTEEPPADPAGESSQPVDAAASDAPAEGGEGGAAPAADASSDSPAIPAQPAEVNAANAPDVGQPADLNAPDAAPTEAEQAASDAIPVQPAEVNAANAPDVAQPADLNAPDTPPTEAEQAASDAIPVQPADALAAGLGGKNAAGQPTAVEADTQPDDGTGSGSDAGPQSVAGTPDPSSAGDGSQPGATPATAESVTEATTEADAAAADPQPGPSDGADQEIVVEEPAADAGAVPTEQTAEDAEAASGADAAAADQAVDPGSAQPTKSGKKSQ
ncbi:hypothetical protein [Nissabacter sp. SGAir0207]|uniref:hypothetical protein n=1 Tax=Nissabacter sp. SGAir0207 TaxID=2126321 RepID=UPI0010CD61D0|nr:hypothetical protein [Nissabacter sp. SGAir0207]QCR36154.1 hypothetical protein C1N62_08645 [Nissabacter sp. SGAir0207]